jgi:hypothetical protein
MKTTYWLQLSLESDAAFGRGDGVAGVVNADIQHDLNGLPYLGGKTLKGLLDAACGEVLSAIGLAKPGQLQAWQASAQRLFGAPGSEGEQVGCLHFGDALLPDDLRAAVARDIQAGKILASDVLESLTTIRRQTAMEAETGAPLKNSLRTIRVILRKTFFIARLDFVASLAGGGKVSKTDQSRDVTLLAASVRALRRAGAHRNRGLGKLKADLFDAYPVQENEVSPVTQSLFEAFRKEVEA